MDVLRSEGRNSLARTLLVVLVTSLTVASVAAAAPPSVRSERQRERAVLAQVAQINSALNVVVEQWDGARVQLAGIQTRIRDNEHVLRIARHNLAHAQRSLDRRLIRLYVDPPPGSLAVSTMPSR